MCVYLVLSVVVFCFKQKTAYGMRISDCSSDVCSSDLLTPRPELLSLFSKIFRKRWNEAEAKAHEGRAAIKREMATIEKKIGQILDKIVQSESRSVIARFESEVDKLEMEKLVLDEKAARCGPVAQDYDAT